MLVTYTKLKKINFAKIIMYYNNNYKYNAMIEKEYYRPTSHHCGSRKPWWNQKLTSHRTQEERKKNGEQRQIRRLKLSYEEEQKNFNQYAHKAK